MGKPKKSEMIMVRMAPVERERLSQLADYFDRSDSDVVRMLINSVSADLQISDHKDGEGTEEADVRNSS